jgi:hypothetical protein
MDPLYFGINLLSTKDVEDARRNRQSAGAAEDAYYRQHAPRPFDRRLLAIVPVIVATLCVGWFGNG